MTIKQLREQREELEQRINDVEALAKNEERDLNADESSEVDNALDAVAGVDKQIDREERKARLFKAEKRQEKKPEAQELGLSDKDVERYSVAKAIRQMSRGQEVDGIEKEVSDEIAKRTGQDAVGCFISFEAIGKRYGQRDMTVGTDAQGGNLVADELKSNMFINLLRNKSIVRQLGAKVLNDLVGNVYIPKQTGAASAYWVDENIAVTESNQAIGQVALTPKTVGAFTEYSDLLLKQGSLDVERFIVDDLTSVLALAIDSAAISGTGADGQPEGITTAVSPTADGSAITNAATIALWSAVAGNNALAGALNYLTTPGLIGKMMNTPKVASTDSRMITEVVDKLNGYGMSNSNQVGSGFGSGTDETALIFGNFNDLMIGLWGGLDVIVDPYTNAPSGKRRVVARQVCDIALRNDESFAYSTFTTA